MLENRIKTHKKAGITIEVALSLLMSIVVLFLVLGLFSGNIKDMSEKGNINNVTQKSNELAKTSFKERDVDPTQTLVQLTGAQGLSYYHEQAKSTIDALAQQNDLTPQQVKNLAKQLTIYGVSGTLAPENEIAEYRAVASAHDILLKFSESITRVGSTQYNWMNNNSAAGTRPSETEQIRLSNIDYINQIFND